MGYKLLLADDSITIQKVVSIIFANEECELAIVDNGDAALEKAAEIVPDIMLVDTLMPGISGYDVCEKVRQSPSLKNIPLLLLSGAFEPFDVDKARDCGADDFISKPFESQQLIDKVKSLVELGFSRKAAAPAPEPAAPAFAEPEPAAPAFASVVSPEEPAWDMEIPEPSVPAQESAPVEESVLEEVQAVEWPLPESPPDEPDIEEPAIGGEMVEASPDDDLWGAFELQAVEDDGDGGDIVETYTVASAAEVDFQGTSVSFEEEVSPAPVTVPDIDTGWEVVQEPAFYAGVGQETAAPLTEVSFSAPPEIEEEAFTFSTENAAFAPEPAAEAGLPGSVPAAGSIAPPPVAPVDTEAAAPFDEAFFFKESDAPAAAAAEPYEAAAPEAAEPVYAPAEEECVPVERVSTGGAAQVTIGDPPGLHISEDKMAEIISRISREVIERIVWEVVPDLAESLIKEEIRKIKEGR